MKHPDWPLFLTAIVAEPDEDTPRLVAADFLEENGESRRAAFIRLQIEIARLEASGMGQSTEAQKLRTKERVDIGPVAQTGPLWGAEECPELVRVVPPTKTSSPLARVNVEGADRLTWRRGFIEGIRGPAAEWLRHGVAVRGRNPVRDLILTRVDQVTRDAWYAGLGTLRGLRKLEMWGDGELTDWLRPWLPGTEVDWLPF
jgi:uncharacterized protein (TIGR02996 family)